MSRMADLHPRHPHTIRYLLAIVLLVIGAFAVGTSAFAQGTPPKLPGTSAPAPAAKPNTAADIDSLIKTLDDPAARDKLKQQLQLLLDAQNKANPAGGTAAPQAEQGVGARMLAVVSHHVNAISNTLVNLVELIADVPQRAQQANVLLSDPIRRAYWMDVVVDVFGVLATA